MDAVTPAGWYPDPTHESQLRYWDGASWTSHDVPLAPSSPPSLDSASQLLQTPDYSAQAAPTQLPPPPPVPAPVRRAKAPRPTARKWIIGGSIAAGVIAVSSIGAAFGGGLHDDATAGSARPPVTQQQSAPLSPALRTPEADAAPDPAAFTAQANAHLDDMVENLDHMRVSVQQEGFLRLLRNLGELGVNLGQLEALPVPARIEHVWPGSLVGLEASVDALSESVSTQDGPTILDSADGVRMQVEVTRATAAVAI